MDFLITKMMGHKACLEWLKEFFHPNILKCLHCQAGLDQVSQICKIKRVIWMCIGTKFVEAYTT